SLDGGVDAPRAVGNGVHVRAAGDLGGAAQLRGDVGARELAQGCAADDVAPMARVVGGEPRRLDIDVGDAVVAGDGQRGAGTGVRGRRVGAGGPVAAR